MRTTIDNYPSAKIRAPFTDLDAGPTDPFLHRGRHAPLILLFPYICQLVILHRVYIDLRPNLVHMHFVHRLFG